MDNANFWIVMIAAVALVVTAATLYVIYAGGRGQDRSPMVDEDGKRIRVPLTVLQVRALWGLIIGTAALAWIVGIFVVRGAENYYVQDDMRISVYLVAFGGAAAYGLLHLITAMRDRGRARDERDIAVLHWAPTVQVVGMSITLVVWAIGLTETYWSVGSVPIAFPTLIFLSTLVVGGLFRALGVLIGYRIF